MRNSMLTFGLIINPYAGIGGAVGLKGSDGPEVVAEAFARGAEQKSLLRAKHALEVIAPYIDQCRFVTCPGDMGESLLIELGLHYSLLDFTPNTPSTAADTKRAAKLMKQCPLDILIFAGGDGTARDICDIVGEDIPVLGIPAGVKIHSGVFGITPTASGEVLAQLLSGGLVDIREAEVRDLDEDAFRNNVVRAKHYGDMRVPQVGHFVQAVKQGGVESEELVLADIAAYIIREMEDDVLYLIGSGKTTQALMNDLRLENTLLGVDAVLNHQLIASDITEADIWQLIHEHERVVPVVSIMGGQGHVFGRGNQQFSARVLRKLGKSAFVLISMKSKILALEGRSLIIDSGEPSLDKEWAGTIEVITGYEDRIVYSLA
jgi:predicted polyphosphate/ATP-dependent NAD kinase